jgi:hypothetical protein
VEYGFVPPFRPRNRPAKVLIYILLERPAEWKPVAALLQEAETRIEALWGNASAMTIRRVLDELATKD